MRADRDKWRKYIDGVGIKDCGCRTCRTEHLWYSCTAGSQRLHCVWERPRQYQSGQCMSDCRTLRPRTQHQLQCQVVGSDSSPTHRLQAASLPLCRSLQRQQTVHTSWYFRDKQGVLKLMVGAWSPLCTFYRVTWYLQLLVLSILTCSPNISFLDRLVSDDSGSLEKLQLGAPSSPATPKEKILHGVWVRVRGYLRIRFDLPSSIPSQI